LDTIDPISGSYYLENITIELAQKVWKAFQQIQSDGGFIELIKNGKLQEEINQSYQKQENNYLFRKQILLGTNKYPLLKEKKPSDCKPFIINTINEDQITQKSFELPLMLVRRFATNFESLRLNAEKFAKKNGTPPTIILLNFGELNEWKPRNDFSWDFLQVGGFEIVSSPVLQDKIEAVQYLNNQQSPIVCVCSSDNRYEVLIPELVPLIKKNKPLTYVILAGYPENKIEEYKTYGIDTFIHLKANAYETLKEIQTINNII